MLERETSALRDEVGELEGAVDNSLWLFNWISFCQAFDTEGEDIDESEPSFLFILWDVDAIGGDSFSDILRRFVYGVVEDSEVFFEHVDCELSDQGGFAAAYCPDQTDRGRSWETAGQDVV